MEQEKRKIGKAGDTGFPTLALLLLVGVASASWYAVSAERHSKTVGNSADAEGIAWLTDYDEALEQARLSKKLVVVDFFATWCGPCEMMHRTTFADEKVQQRMADFVPLKIDVDRDRDVAARYGVNNVPTTLVIEADGRPVVGAMGYLDGRDYLGVLDSAESGGTRKIGHPM